jgi:hypothetical protein
MLQFRKSGVWQNGTDTTRMITDLTIIQGLVRKKFLPAWWGPLASTRHGLQSSPGSPELSGSALGRLKRTILLNARPIGDAFYTSDDHYPGKIHMDIVLEWRGVMYVPFTLRLVRPEGTSDFQFEVRLHHNMTREVYRQAAKLACTDVPGVAASGIPAEEFGRMVERRWPAQPLRNHRQTEAWHELEPELVFVLTEDDAGDGRTINIKTLNTLSFDVPFSGAMTVGMVKFHLQLETGIPRRINASFLEACSWKTSEASTTTTSQRKAKYISWDVSVAPDADASCMSGALLRACARTMTDESLET